MPGSRNCLHDAINLSLSRRQELVHVSGALLLSRLGEDRPQRIRAAEGAPLFRDFSQPGGDLIGRSVLALSSQVVDSFESCNNLTRKAAGRCAWGWSAVSLRRGGRGDRESRSRPVRRTVSLCIHADPVRNDPPPARDDFLLHLQIIGG